MRKTSRNRAPGARSAPDALTELQVDLLLSLREGPAEAGDLLDRIARWRGAEAPLATVYRQLQRALDGGWLTLEEGTSQATDGSRGPGRPGRQYRLTAAGERRLEEALGSQQRRLEHARSLGLLGRAGAGRSRS
ncbi:MAG TPA: hypothetical protein VMT85_09655 [Thermoanaerobaculia bacterium]|nr:hypothetical protein [Thermoanaerobaculia bacterium]